MSGILMFFLAVALVGGIIHGLCQICGSYHGRDYSSNNLFSFFFTDKY